MIIFGEAASDYIVRSSAFKTTSFSFTTLAISNWVDRAATLVLTIKLQDFSKSFYWFSSNCDQWAATNLITFLFCFMNIWNRLYEILAKRKKKKQRIITVTEMMKPRSEVDLKRLDKSCKDVGTRYSIVVSFTAIHQIFSVPQAQLLPFSNWGWVGKNRQHDFGRKWVISQNAGPLIAVSHELACGKKDAVGWRCYDNIDFFSQPMVDTTTPVRPIGGAAFITPNITIQMNKFDWHQFASGGYKELAKLVASGTKTDRGSVQLDPWV